LHSLKGKKWSVVKLQTCQDWCQILLKQMNEKKLLDNEAKSFLKTYWTIGNISLFLLMVGIGWSVFS